MIFFPFMSYIIDISFWWDMENILLLEFVPQSSFMSFCLFALIRTFLTSLVSIWPSSYVKNILMKHFSQNTLVNYKIIFIICLLSLKHQTRMFSSLCMTRIIFIGTWETFLEVKIPLIDLYSPKSYLEKWWKILGPS